MDRQIQFHSLLKDELIYEVTIGSETPSATVDSLRKQLRVLSEECPSEAILETDFSVDSELKVVTNKLTELGTVVDRYTQTQDKYSFNRSKALGYHLFHRLTRIHVQVNTAKFAIKAELLLKLESLLVKIEPSELSSSVVDNRQALSSGSDVSQGDLQIECSGDKNISKWGLKFYGTTNPRSFLERVDELKLAFGVSETKLFNSVAQLFVDKGLLWFRGIKHQVSSWKELKAILLQEFDPTDYDYRLMSEIRSRTQGIDEPVHIYFAIMSCMFERRSTPLSEEEKSEILQHNIRPHFSQQLALVNVSSVAELKQHCRNIEAARQRTENFTEPKSTSNIFGQ